MKHAIAANLRTIAASIFAPDEQRSAKTAYVRLKGISVKRPTYLLLHALRGAGYRIKFRADLKELLKMEVFGRRIFEQKLAAWSPVPPIRAASLYVSNDAAAFPGKRPFLHMDVDIFSPADLSGTDKLFLPIHFYPQFLEPGMDGPPVPVPDSGDRDIAVFFAGAMDQENYDRADTRELFGITTRYRFIQAIRERIDPKILFEPRTFDELQERLAAGSLKNSVVVCDTGSCKIPWSEWFRVLGRCRFVLSPPGVVQPYCHNTVEAMAMGAVPILEYPRMYQPELLHGMNCLSFAGERELVDRIEAVLAGVYDGKYAEMNSSARAYFRDHLDIPSFAARLDAFIASGLGRGTVYVCQNTLSVSLLKAGKKRVNDANDQ